MPNAITAWTKNGLSISTATRNISKNTPSIIHTDPFFHFEITHQSSKSMARVGRLHTPHGTVDTPGFVPVATNGALKGVDFRFLDGDAPQVTQKFLLNRRHGGGNDKKDTVLNKQLVFCNTYHLLLHPGPDIIRDSGGIHQFTGRRDGGPFITDSGGFQVFSLAYGSVQEELASMGELKRSVDRSRRLSTKTTDRRKQNWRYDVVGEDAVQVTEEGVTFKSYRDGSRFLLTPESTVQAQKAIGADIIIPLDELPPYHIDRNKLEESMER